MITQLETAAHTVKKNSPQAYFRTEEKQCDTAEVPYCQQS